MEDEKQGLAGEATEDEKQGLTGEDILQADDIKVVRVDVPEWGDKPVYVRTLTGVQRMQWGNVIGELNDDGHKHLLPACSVTLTLCDELGEPPFEGTSENGRARAAKCGSAILAVFEKADEINAFTAKAVEDIEEN